MNKQEWIESFEAINGRKPSVAELGQAMQNGEIIDENVSKSAVEQSSRKMNQQEWIEYFELTNGRKPTPQELQLAFQESKITPSESVANAQPDYHQKSINGTSKIANQQEKISKVKNKKPLAKIFGLLALVVVGLFFFLSNFGPVETYQGKFNGKQMEVQLKKNEALVTLDGQEMKGEITGEETGVIQIQEFNGEALPKDNPELIQAFSFEYKKLNEEELWVYSPGVYKVMQEENGSLALFAAELTEGLTDSGFLGGLIGFFGGMLAEASAQENSQAILTKVTGDTVASDEEEYSDDEYSDEDYHDEEVDELEIEDEAKTSNSESMVVTDDELDDYREHVEEEFDDELIEIFRNHKETGKYNEAKKNFLETLREGIEAEGFDNESVEKLVGLWEEKFDELEARNFASQKDAPGEQELTIKAVQMIDTSSEMYIDIVDGLPADFDVDYFMLEGRVRNKETNAQKDFEGQIKFEKLDGVYRSRLSARKLPDGSYTSELFGTVKTDKKDYEFRGFVESVIKDGKFMPETFEK